jgi:thiamine pyrophosphate-dependent acetolactate synthase large subunit-like protein
MVKTTPRNQIAERAAKAATKGKRLPVATDHRGDARQLAADRQAHDAELLRMVNIDPDKLTTAEIKKAAGLVAQVTRNHCFVGANARRPKAAADLQAFIAAHPDARLAK